MTQRRIHLIGMRPSNICKKNLNFSSSSFYILQEVEENIPPLKVLLISYALCTAFVIFLICWKETRRKIRSSTFYEEFLTFYDPALRKSLWRFYTPVQAVQYLISFVDKILVEDFDIEGGLSNNEQITTRVPCAPYKITKNKWSDEMTISVPRVAILDPACGTGFWCGNYQNTLKTHIFLVLGRILRKLYSARERLAFPLNWV